MMTDCKKLEEMKAKLLNSEKNTYDRMKKENVLNQLIYATDSKTGELLEKIYIPLYEHDGEFLKEILKELGYSPVCEKGYNHLLQTMCYKVSL